jgi:hypothetical protein
MKLSFGAITKNSQAFLGALTLISGFALMWASTSGQRQDDSTVTKAASEAVAVDPLQPSARYNGRLVVAAGRLSSIETLEDEYLKAAQYLILIRHVEMYQWVENRTSKADGPARYAMEWYEGQQDFFTFQEPTGHENPLLKVFSKKFLVPTSSFGAFEGRKILDAIEYPPRLELTASLLKDPLQKIENNKLIVPREPDQVGIALGDMRVWYNALSVGEYTVAARQEDEMTLLGSTQKGVLVVKPGKLSVEELFADVGRESANTYSGLMYIGGVVTFLGLFSILIRIAPQMNLRPRFEVQGPLAVFVVSVGITLVTMVIFFILGLVS